MGSMIWLATLPHVCCLHPQYFLSSPKYARWNGRSQESGESWGQEPAKGFSAGTASVGSEWSEVLETAKVWSLPAHISFWCGKSKFESPASSRYSNLVGTVHKFPSSTGIWGKQRNSRLFSFPSFHSKDVLFLSSNNKTPQWYEVFFSLCQQRLLYMTELSACMCVARIFLWRTAGLSDKLHLACLTRTTHL